MARYVRDTSTLKISCEHSDMLIANSPFHTSADDPDELFVPAVQGTLGILNSLEKNWQVSESSANQ